MTEQALSGLRTFITERSVRHDTTDSEIEQQLAHVTALQLAMDAVSARQPDAAHQLQATIDNLRGFVEARTGSNDEDRKFLYAELQTLEENLPIDNTNIIINRVWERAMEARIALAHAWVDVDALERKARFELDEDDQSWSKARSGDIRKHLVEVYYGESEHYAEARAAYEEAKLNLRVALMDVERVKMLVAYGHLDGLPF